VNRRGDSPLAIGRVAVTRATTPGAFERYVRQRVARERFRRVALQVPKRFLGLHRYDVVRRRLIGERRAAPSPVGS
jgi:hypothetical protein